MDIAHQVDQPTEMGGTRRWICLRIPEHGERFLEAEEHVVVRIRPRAGGEEREVGMAS